MTEAGHSCSVQHCSEHIVEIHHIDENRDNNDPSNLIVLCDKHHKLAHKKNITRMELKDYKKLLSQPKSTQYLEYSKHDSKLLIEINEIFSYEKINLIKNECFRNFVKEEVISPFIDLFYRLEDPLFKFTDQKLEHLRSNLIVNAQKFMSHFSEQSAGLEGGYAYIDLEYIQRKNNNVDINYLVQYSNDTVRLAHDFCESMLLLRAELINL